MTEKTLNPVPFTLGPWPSTADLAWRAAFDGIVAQEAAVGRPLYGLLTADLSPIPLDDALETGRRGQRDEAEAWIAAWVANAVGVIARYRREVALFEVLPQPNLSGPSGHLPRVHPAWYAALLTTLQAQLRKSVRGDVTLVAGALLGGQAGRGSAGAYARAAIRAGREQWDWPRQGFGPVAAWAMHPAVDAARGGAAGRAGDGGPAGATAGGGWAELSRFASSMRRRAGPEARVYVTGLTARAAPGGRGGGAREAEATAAAELGARVAADGRFVVAVPSAWEGPLAPLPATRGGPEERMAEDVAAWPVQRVAVRARVRDLPPEVPLADGFDPPVGARDGAAWAEFRRDTELADDYYFQNVIKGAWHPGEDWNRGYGNQDEGEPIHAIAHGLVTAARSGRGTWGNIVLVEHHLPDGSRVWSQYAHLLEVLVNEGQVVARGQQVGTLGRGNPPPKSPWTAHLHFEIRHTDLPFDNWSPTVRDKEQVLANYAAPKDFIDRHRPGTLVTTTGPAVIVDEKDPGFQRADVPHWSPSDIGHGGGAVFTFASPSTAANTATWTAQLPAPGRYLVSVFVPRREATTRNATYTVVHRGGEAVARVNQAAVSDVWVPLGVFDCESPAVVRLSDVTGEPAAAKRKVCFDAVKWQPVA